MAKVIHDEYTGESVHRTIELPDGSIIKRIVDLETGEVLSETREGRKKPESLMLIY